MMIWQPIPEWPRYEASSNGDICCALTGIILIPRLMGGPTRSDRRPSVQLLHDDGRYRWRFVGRLVCMAFHGSPPTEKHQAAHGNGNSLDNRPSNLRWATPLQNNHDRYRHGTMPRGDRAPNRTIDSVNVVRLRAAYRALKAKQIRAGKGKLPNGTITRLAAKYGVSKRTARSIARRETWKHI